MEWYLFYCQQTKFELSGGVKGYNYEISAQVFLSDESRHCGPVDPVGLIDASGAFVYTMPHWLNRNTLGPCDYADYLTSYPTLGEMRVLEETQW